MCLSRNAGSSPFSSTTTIRARSKLPQAVVVVDKPYTHQHCVAIPVSLAHLPFLYPSKPNGVPVHLCSILRFPIQILIRSAADRGSEKEISCTNL